MLQSNPAVGENIYEFNLHPIQPHQLIFKSNPKNGRLSVKSWFERFRWLEFSATTDLAYFYTCRIFSKKEGNTEQSYIKNGFDDWKQGPEKFSKHERTTSHRLASLLLESNMIFLITQRKTLIPEKMLRLIFGQAKPLLISVPF